MDCIFCKIAAREIPAEVVFEDEFVFAFRDINPVAPTHILIVPKMHYNSLANLTEADAPLAARLLLTAARLARREGLDENGYRVVSNIGSDGGQSVAHLHLHLIGGRKLKWEQ